MNKKCFYSVGLAMLLHALPLLAAVDPGLKIRAEAEKRAAVGIPGLQVCKPVTIGIGVVEWIKGKVLAIEGDTLQIRIEVPGRYGQRINGIELNKDAIIKDVMSTWTTCAY